MTKLIPPAETKDEYIMRLESALQERDALLERWLDEHYPGDWRHDRDLDTKYPANHIAGELAADTVRAISPVHSERGTT